MKDDELREIIAGHGGSLDGTADRPKLQQRAQEVVESLSRRLNDARQCTRYVQDIEVAQQNAVALRELLRDRPTRATAVGALLADPNAVPQLVNVARAPTASLATRAVLFECLGELGDASAESPVHRDGLAVDAALRALGMRSPPDQYADQQSQDAMHAAATAAPRVRAGNRRHRRSRRGRSSLAPRRICGQHRPARPRRCHRPRPPRPPLARRARRRRRPRAPNQRARAAAATAGSTRMVATSARRSTSAR